MSSDLFAFTFVMHGDNPLVFVVGEILALEGLLGELPVALFSEGAAVVRRSLRCLARIVQEALDHEKLRVVPILTTAGKRHVCEHGSFALCHD
jgi:hypothetical protein